MLRPPKAEGERRDREVWTLMRTGATRQTYQARRERRLREPRMELCPKAELPNPRRTRLC
ncbi:hypothetical protein PAGU2595_029650 [Lysobacter xanthus]